MTVNPYSQMQLMQMHQQQFQELMRQQMVLPPSGMYGLGGLIGQAQTNPYHSNPLSAFATQHASTASIPKIDPVKVEYPERGVHDHLQRRVNKWLSGVNLPLH